MTVQEALARIVRDDFFRAETQWASDAHAARQFIANSEEVRALENCDRQVLAALEQRALALIGKPISAQGPFIVYTTVFVENGYTRAIPILTRFLRSYPPGETDYLLARENPLEAVVDALEKLAAGSFAAPGVADLLGQRLEIADRADAWFSRHVGTAGRKCRQCGHPVPEGKKFCGKDGTRVP